MLKMPRITMSAKWQGREEPLQMMAARIRAHAWGATSLGPADGWPQA